MFLSQGIWSSSPFYTAMAEVKRDQCHLPFLDALGQSQWVPSHVHAVTHAHHPFCDVQTYKPCVIVVTNKYSKAKSSNAE